MKNEFRFDGLTAIVTGAGSGIGQATAVRLADEGAHVAIIDIDGKAANRVRVEIEEKGGRAFVVAIDVSDPLQVREAVVTVQREIGIPQVLINNAGILRLAAMEETSDELFELVLRTNLFSVFYFARETARVLLENRLSGSFVNVSSIHAVVSEPNAGAYTAAKGGIEAMSRTMASEWARRNIRVNCVRPGATNTSLSKPLYTEEVIRALRMRVPMGTIASPAQIAAGICFLASSEADYITGTTLDIDGGYVMDGSLPGLAYE
jgi:NAD(P)-dependent dehydrogenase (short-subunit alcohol dehydrogenase family)